ncbi:MAG: chemotaxis protein CheD [Armatimonadota bacterium]|nr:chemotaxis protein CheD [Armatimonadota bacterium]MDR7439014.1 chemotaxis protein CheD [Armatimonadota bacterium]MDR7563612.1 chemotaxis protein CheD [Armatimonadota bacterium]MDR7566860.1 chemotaxis protein CheD [Armatimonadota bacterium]MDR7601217.1 chemotaxis protein CheD [Armatimonadota bacterium]
MREARVIRVGMGEGVVERDAQAVLVAGGLGSCVAVVLHSPRPLVGAMAHVMLPQAFGLNAVPFKFADTAVPALLESFRQAGGDPAFAVVWIVGGAGMFGIAPGNVLNLGARNVEAVREALHRQGLRPHAEDVGGSVSRTVSLHVGTGRLVVRTAGGAEREL